MRDKSRCDLDKIEKRLRTYKIKIALILIIAPKPDDDINRNEQTSGEAKEKGHRGR